MPLKWVTAQYVTTLVLYIPSVSSLGLDFCLLHPVSADDFAKYKKIDMYIHT